MAASLDGKINLQATHIPTQLSHNRFSAMREKDGTISNVFYQSEDSQRLLALKKTLAGLFSVDLASGSWFGDGVSVVAIHDGVNDPPAGGLRVSKKTTIDRTNRVITEVATDQQMDHETGEEVFLQITSHSQFVCRSATEGGGGVSFHYDTVNSLLIAYSSSET